MCGAEISASNGQKENAVSQAQTVQLAGLDASGCVQRSVALAGGAATGRRRVRRRLVLANRGVGRASRCGRGRAGRGTGRRRERARRRARHPRVRLDARGVRSPRRVRRIVDRDVHGRCRVRVRAGRCRHRRARHVGSSRRAWIHERRVQGGVRLRDDHPQRQSRQGHRAGATEPADHRRPSRDRPGRLRADALRRRHRRDLRVHARRGALRLDGRVHPRSDRADLYGGAAEWSLRQPEGHSRRRRSADGRSAGQLGALHARKTVSTTSPRTT